MNDRSEPASTRIVAVLPNDPAAAETVEYAARSARNHHAETGERVRLDVLVEADPTGEPSAALTEAIEALEPAFRAALDGEIAVSGAALGGRDPRERAEALATRLDGTGPLRLLVDPRTDLDVEPLRQRLGLTTVEVAPADRPHRRRRLVRGGGGRRTATVFVASYLFYLAVGGFALGLDLLTGALSAAVVAGVLGRVTLLQEPALRRTGGRLVRLAVALPVLGWAVIKANVWLAYVLLHPQLPIDPRIERLETDTREDLERMVLANAITVTPGTLTVDVRGPTMIVHSLTATAWEDLEGGRVERLVAWVFRGRARERGEP